MKRTRLIISTIALALALTAPGAAHAQFEVISNWISGQNVLLTQILSEEYLRNISLIPQTIKLATDSLSSVNKVASTVRDAYNLEESIRNYTVDQLVNDVKEGLGRTFPELQDLESEIGDLQGNVNGLRNGRQAFFATKGKYDDKMWSYFEKSNNAVMGSTILPVIAPNVSAKAGIKQGDAKTAVYAALYSAGFYDDWKTETFRNALMTEEVKRYYDNAHKQRNAVAEGIALNNTILSEMANNQKLQAEIASMNVAKEQENAALRENRKTKSMKIYEEEKKKKMSIGDLWKTSKSVGSDTSNGQNKY